METAAPNIGEDLACAARYVDAEAVLSARARVGGAPWLAPMAELFGALGDPTRLKLLASLAQGPLCTCDLSAILEVTDSAVSHQLRMLKELGLVRSRREGKFMYHELADEHVRGLIEFARHHVEEVVR